MSAPLLMTVPEAARYLGRSAWWVRERVGEGAIPAKAVGSRFFVSRPDLDRWLAGDSPGEQAVTLGAPSPKKGRRVG